MKGVLARNPHASYCLLPLRSGQAVEDVARPHYELRRLHLIGMVAVVMVAAVMVAAAVQIDAGNHSIEYGLTAQAITMYALTASAIAI